MKTRARIVSGLAALAALFLAPLAEASLTRATSAAIEAPSLTLSAPASAPYEFSLFEGHELTAAAAESERALSFHPLAAVSLLPKDGAEAPLVSAEELSYPKTRYRVFGFLGAPLIGVERGVSLELHWGSGEFRAGLASGTVGWLSQDPLGDVDSPNLYGFVGARPHEKTDPLGLVTYTQGGGANYLGNAGDVVRVTGFWSQTASVGLDFLGNTVSDLLMLSTIAEKSAVVGDTTRSTKERVVAGTVGLGTAAFDIAGGEILGTAGKVLARVPGANRLISKVANGRVGRILAKDVGELAESALKRITDPLGMNSVGDAFGQGLNEGAAEAAAALAPDVPKLVPHKNSRAYVGETHVYVIRDPQGAPYKIGESAAGKRLSDAASIRAEKQVRRLNREQGPGFSSEVRQDFTGKDPARDYETEFIERFRSMFGADTLPGNKTNR